MSGPAPSTVACAARAVGLVTLAAVLVLGGAACGKQTDQARTNELSPALRPQPAPPPAQNGDDEGEDQPSSELGFPGFATKNTTRIAGTDATQNAAAAALAVFPAQFRTSRPLAVTLVDQADWRTALAATALMGPPLRAPLLFSDGDEIPDVTQTALEQLGPRGAELADGAQVIRVGSAPEPEDLRTTDIAGDDPVALARAIDRFRSAAAGEPSRNVLVVPSAAPAFAMPAAAWAAKTGDAVLFADRDRVPAATQEALRERDQPGIFVLGPRAAIGPGAMAQLRRLGRVQRISGPDPVRNAIAFARFQEAEFGWGVIDPGHGVVFAAAQRPLDAAAAAPLSSSGTYGPLLVLNEDQRLPSAVTSYLLDIQPGFREDPTRGVYNRAWLIGDAGAISVADQARIDTLLEIAPIQETPPS